MVSRSFRAHGVSIPVEPFLKSDTSGALATYPGNLFLRHWWAPDICHVGRLPIRLNARERPEGNDGGSSVKPGRAFSFLSALQCGQYRG